MRNNTAHNDVTESCIKNQITVRCVTTVEEFSELRQVWNDIAVGSDSTIYQTFEWSYLWWENYSTEQQYNLHILLFFDHKQLVGIAPLFIYKKYFYNKMFYKSLRFLATGTAFGVSFGLFADDGPSDYLDILILPGYEPSVAESFWEYLSCQQNTYDEIELLNLREDSKFINYFIPAIDTYEFKYRRYKTECCPYINTPKSIDNFFKSLTPSVRRRMVQTYKAAEESKIYTIKTPESSEEFQKAYDELVQLHQDRWNRMGYLGFFSDKRYSNLFASLSRVFLKNGWVWFKSAYSDNRCVAGRLAFKFNGRYYDYLTGFDELAPAAKRRPGIALLLDMLKDAIDDNSKHLDLLRGDESYKFELTSAFTCNWNYIITLKKKNRFEFVRLLKAILLLSNLISFLKHREKKLFKVQRMHHNYFSAIYYYTKFRVKNLISKVKRLTLKKQNL